MSTLGESARVILEPQLSNKDKFKQRLSVIKEKFGHNTYNTSSEIAKELGKTLGIKKNQAQAWVNYAFNNGYFDQRESSEYWNGRPLMEYRLRESQKPMNNAEKSKSDYKEYQISKEREKLINSSPKIKKLFLKIEFDDSCGGDETKGTSFQYNIVETNVLEAFEKLSKLGIVFSK